jgi:hypothetical protein
VACPNVTCIPDGKFPYVHVLQVHGLLVLVPHVLTSAFNGVPRILVTSCSLMPIFSDRLFALKLGGAGAGGGGVETGAGEGGGAT